MMKIVTAKMHPKKREVILKEVEFDGTIEGLFSILNLNKYTESEEIDDGLYLTTASDLIVTDNHAYISNGCDEGRGRIWRINNMVIGDGYEFAFVGFINIIDGIPPLTIDYLRSTIMHATPENPDILTESEKQEEEQKRIETELDLDKYYADQNI